MGYKNEIFISLAQNRDQEQVPVIKVKKIKVPKTQKTFLVKPPATDF
jgi:hypothetical protein